MKRNIILVLILISSQMGSVSRYTYGDTSSKDLPRKIRILMIVAPLYFTDEELDVPKDIFEANDVQVTVASTKTGEIVGVFGLTAKSDLLFRDVKVDEYDAFVVVGGISVPTFLVENQDLLAMLRDADKKRKLIAAICLGPQVLASAGILNGKKATVNPMDYPIQVLKESGAVYVDEEVVVSGNIITGNGPTASRQFATKICESLGIKAVIN